MGGETSKGATVVRWTARLTSALAAAVILLFFVGEGLAEGFAPLLHMSVREMTMMVAFAAVWAGLVLGWRWEVWGGSLTLGGLAAFYVLDYAFSGTFPRGPYVVLLASPSLLFLFSGWRGRRSSAQ